MKVEVPDELLESIGVTGNCTLSFGLTEIGWEQQKRKYAQGIYFYRKDWDKLISRATNLYTEEEKEVIEEKKEVIEEKKDVKDSLEKQEKD